MPGRAKLRSARTCVAGRSVRPGAGCGPQRGLRKRGTFETSSSPSAAARSDSGHNDLSRGGDGGRALGRPLMETDSEALLPEPGTRSPTGPSKSYPRRRPAGARDAIDQGRPRTKFGTAPPEAPVRDDTGSIPERGLPDGLVPRQHTGTRPRCRSPNARLAEEKGTSFARENRVAMLGIGSGHRVHDARARGKSRRGAPPFCLTIVASLRGPGSPSSWLWSGYGEGPNRPVRDDGDEVREPSSESTGRRRAAQQPAARGRSAFAPTASPRSSFFRESANKPASGGEIPARGTPRGIGARGGGAPGRVRPLLLVRQLSTSRASRTTEDPRWKGDLRGRLPGEGPRGPLHTPCSGNHDPPAAATRRPDRVQRKQESARWKMPARWYKNVFLDVP
jgi:hypothetical protein